LQRKLQHDVSKKAETNSEWRSFNEFPERRFELAGDFQDSEYLFVAGFQFREEFLRLQLKCDLLVGGQDHAYSF
jgi:hypothetical protein